MSTETKPKVDDTKNKTATEVKPEVVKANGAGESNEILSEDSQQLKKGDYDEWYNSRSEARKVEGGEMTIASGLEKGRPVKEDGTLDLDAQTEFDKRFSTKVATETSAKSE